MYYVGILWVPFQECCYQINIEAMEVGVTGGREAAVMLIEKDKWPSPSEGTAPVMLKSADELFERLGAAPIRQLPSDAEKYDSSFPDHPLSKVRFRLAQVTSTLKLERHGAGLNPYRVRSWWQFWK
jgi:hypothetical protein